ncbi:MAG: hypothetical protein KC912_00565 [Proteobacteria bacterium]|nr:hypothetical protein [Pseudomonadota bacterium]
MWRWTSAFTASLALLGSCGGLVGGDYRGEALYTVHGSVFVDPDDPDASWPDAPLRVAIFWAGADGFNETEQAVVIETEFPARYSLSIYQPPPPGVLFYTPWHDAKVAVGVPMLYLDHNEDHRWTPNEEPIVGGSYDLAVVYAEASHGQATLDVQEGYQSMWALDEVCDDRVATGTEFFPADGAPMDLFVGAYWEYVRDWDCDGSYDEWQEACPPPPDMQWLCDNDPLAFDEDPFLQECEYLCE